MLDDLNSGLRQVGRLELLESVADQAFAYYGDMTPQQMSRSTGQPAVALQRVAEVIDSQGDLKRAVSIMQRSISGLEHLVAIEPANELAWFRLGTAQSYMADLLRTNGNFANK